MGGVRRARTSTWLAVVWRSAADLLASDGLVWAGALAFYTLLSLFPLVIAAIIAASYLTDPTWVAERIVGAIEEFLPSRQLDVATLVAGAEEERGRLGLIALFLVLVTGRRVLGTLIMAMDRMSDIDQDDDPIRRRAMVELGLVAGLAVLIGLSLAVRPALALVERALGLATIGGHWLGIAILETIQAGLILAAFVLVYQMLPVGRRSARAVLVGAVAALVLFLVLRAAFTLVVGWVWDTLSTLYGPLTTAVFLLIWVYWVALVVLFGASLASHTQVMVIQGRSGGEAQRRHVPRTDPAEADGTAD